MTSKVDLRNELDLHNRGYAYVAGLDEAGRGAWAGPVVAGAAILPLGRFDLLYALEGVNDSKLLTPLKREALLPRILQTALATSVGYATNREIDTLGIVPATRLAMQRALAALPVQPDALLTDAMRMPDIDLPCTSLIKGDQRSLSIAAASIIAKVTRDQFMRTLDDLFPHYGFRVHKGYGTPLHKQALAHFGPSDAHRMTFAPVRALGESDQESNTL